jgi:signal transduction histidine kinase
MYSTASSEPAVDNASDMITALASLATARFSSFAEAVEVYLITAARLSGVRSAFVSQLDGRSLELLGSWSRGGCVLPASGMVALEEVPCQYVRADAAPVLISDTRSDPRVQNLPALTTMGIGAYLGVPMLLDDGAVLGSFCMVDPEPRPFSVEQAQAVTVLAQQLVRLVERELAQRATVQIERETAEDLGAALSALDERGLLLQTVAHDLRTPLTSIRGYADMVARGMFGAVNMEQATALTHISASSRFMGRLINDLLDMSQADHGSLILSSEPYGPEELIRKVHELSAGQAAEQGLRLEVAADAELPQAIGDPIRIQQMLLNLVSNALRYTADGCVTLRAALRDGQLEYSVTDTGPGIAPEALPHIWQLGWRGPGRGRGTGLGLYLVRRIGEAMGGSVSVESAPGAGSIFALRLPLTAERPVRATLV